MPALVADGEDLFDDDTDLLYEEDILRNAYSLKYWWRYLEAKRRAPARQRNLIAERALKYLPGCYKIWHAYLNDRRDQVKNRKPGDAGLDNLSRTYERALVYMHKMPRIWLDYLTFLSAQHRTTETRHAFDRALRALPVTQHERIWELYLAFARACNVPETAVRIYRRYLQFDPDSVEDYIDFLLSIGRVSEAALKLAELLNRESFASLRGKSRHKLWMELCELVCKNPTQVKGLRVEAIIRSGLRTFTDEAGHLWCALADFFIRQALFEQARDVYEEGISSVITVRDFSMIFDAYSQFEESLISAQIEQQAAQPSETMQEELDMRLARLERLMERRAELLSSVLLRQNPHNVHEWIKRAALFEGQPAKVIHTLATAVKTVDPMLAVGRPHTLWLHFAKFYETHNDLKNARVILRKATQVPFKTVDDLASVWNGWAEMELRHKKYPEALAVMAEATTIPPASKRSKEALQGAPVQGRLFKHTKLWSFYADLQESLAGFDEAKATYDKIIELRIITPQLILNYAAFLEEHRHFELSFQAYEKGVSLFKHPHVLQVWIPYLTKFITRYAGTKLERTRDLFEQALDGCPASEMNKLFLLYASFEEQHGLVRNAMSVYDRAVDAIAIENREEMFNMYIAKAAEYFGVTKTRDIYEKAINMLSPAQVADMCVRYANLERKLGEIDRARAIYMHGAQDVNPSGPGGKDTPFWRTWHDFEVAHGNEDTFREMLRIKRSVGALFTSAQVTAPAAGEKRGRDDEGDAPAGGAMEQLERTSDANDAFRQPAPAAGGVKLGGFSAAASFEGARSGFVFKMGEFGLGYYRDLAGGGAVGGSGAAAAVESEEIDIGDGDEEEEVEEMAVPSAVFGAAGIGGESDAPLGALERFKRQKGGDGS